MRTFIITAFILLLSLQGVGQIKRIDKFDGPLLFGIKETNEDFFNESEYILEVKIISAKEYWRGKPITSEYSPFHLSEDEEDEFNLDYHNEMILVSYLYKVLYVYKGNEVKKADTIEFFIPKKLSEYNACGYAYLMNFNPPYKGVIFGKKSNDKGKSPYFTIAPLVNLDYAALYYSDSQEEHNFRLYGLRDLYFKSKADFYEYASQFDGITVPKIKREIPHEDFYVHKARFTDFMNKQYALVEKAKANKKRMGIKTNRNLTISIKNQKISNDNDKRYIEFDVYAQANSNDTYYSNAISRITFNPSIFGVNLASYGRITLTKGKAFDNKTYTVNAYDLSPAVVYISLSEAYSLSSWNRTKLTTTPQILFHVKIEILYNAENGYLNTAFTQIDFTDDFSLYSLSANGNTENLIPYNNTIFIAGKSDKK